MGWTRSPLLIAIALSATSLGLVVPVLKDAGQAGGVIGQTIIASATVADFAAIVLLTLFLDLRSGCWLNAHDAHHPRGPGRDCWPAVDPGGPLDALGRGAGAAQHTTAEIRIRMSVALLIGFVATWLAQW